jgi:hypothetical protein
VSTAAKSARGGAIRGGTGLTRCTRGCAAHSSPSGARDVSPVGGAALQRRVALDCTRASGRAFNFYLWACVPCPASGTRSAASP